MITRKEGRPMGEPVWQPGAGTSPKPESWSGLDQDFYDWAAWFDQEVAAGRDPVPPERALTYGSKPGDLGEGHDDDGGDYSDGPALGPRPPAPMPAVINLVVHAGTLFGWDTTPTTRARRQSLDTPQRPCPHHRPNQLFPQAPVNVVARKGHAATMARGLLPPQFGQGSPCVRYLPLYRTKPR